MRSGDDAVPRQLRRAANAALIAIGAGLIFVPLLLTVYVSTFDEEIVVFPPKGYTLRWYAQILPHFGSAIATSLIVASAATAAALLVGVPAGIGLARARFAGRGAVSALLLAPLTVPGIAIGLGLYICAIAFEEQTGVPLAGSIALLIAGHLLITTPWVIRLCMASLVNADASIEDAAASLGAAPLRVFWRVTLPVMRHGIVAGGLFAFIVSFESLEMTLFLVAPGVTTLPIAQLGYLKYHLDPLVSATAVAQIAVVAVGLLVLNRFIRPAQAIA